MVHFVLYLYLKIKLMINSVYKKTRVCIKKTSGLRLAKRQKAEFTVVKEHFCSKRNEKIGIFLQTLNKIGLCAVLQVS